MEENFVSWKPNQGLNHHLQLPILRKQMIFFEFTGEDYHVLMLAKKEELHHYLYTTPPKKLIKDTSQDFFAASFIPGAIVHFSIDLPKDDAANSGPFLQEDVMSLKGLDFVPETTKEPTESTSETVVANDHPIIRERKPADKKAAKPKWLKM
ncbi:Plant UBX domain-containing protein 1 [Bienertia sinuspersici]